MLVRMIPGRRLSHPQWGTFVVTRVPGGVAWIKSGNPGPNLTYVLGFVAYVDDAWCAHDNGWEQFYKSI